MTKTSNASLPLLQSKISHLYNDLQGPTPLGPHCPWMSSTTAPRDFGLAHQAHSYFRAMVSAAPQPAGSSPICSWVTPHSLLVSLTWGGLPSSSKTAQPQPPPGSRLASPHSPYTSASVNCFLCWNKKKKKKIGCLSVYCNTPSPHYSADRNT